jgi:hypothetical protein
MHDCGYFTFEIKFHTELVITNKSSRHPLGTDCILIVIIIYFIFRCLFHIFKLFYLDTLVSQMTYLRKHM